MPRPRADQSQFVDAVVLARAGTVLEQHYVGAELPRWLQSGVAERSNVVVEMHFHEVQGHAAVSGRLTGVAVMTCQRCLMPVDVALNDPFQWIMAEAEAAGLPEDYDAVEADPTRLDLKWLSEEQALLALPLVPMHAQDMCPTGQSVGIEDEPRQRPFENLRDLLNKS